MTYICAILALVVSGDLPEPVDITFDSRPGVPVAVSATLGPRKVRLLISSAASHLALSPQHLSAVGLERYEIDGKKVILDGYPAFRLPESMTLVLRDKLNESPAYVSDAACEFDMSAIDFGIGPVDGILGVEWMKQQPFILDFARSRIQLFKRLDGHITKLVEEERGDVFEASVMTYPVKMGLNLLSSASQFDGSTYDKLLAAGCIIPLGNQITIGASGENDRPFGILKSLTAFNRTFNNVPVHVGPRNLVGTAILRQLRICIDLPRGVLITSDNPDAEAPLPPYSILGVSVEHVKGMVTVAVEPGLGYRLGIRTNQVVAKINGDQQFDVFDAGNAFRGLKGTVSLRRPDGSLLELNLDEIGKGQFPAHYDTNKK